MERDKAIELQRRGLEALFRFLAGAAETSRLVEFPGVIASLIPACPTRSFPNSVVYESAEELASALDALAVEYRHAGVGAWTVWVPEDETTAAGLLDRAGHRRDAAPAAMAIELAGLPDPGPDVEGLDWDAEATAAEVGRVNDRAYGWDDAGFSAALTTVADLGFETFGAIEMWERRDCDEVL
jgi:hypothetical protein